jgi:ankyrin repeat protein
MSFNNLIKAICDNDENCVSGLINQDYINNTIINGFTPLIVSICKQYINITKLLLNADNTGIDINKCEEKNKCSPLYIAAQIGNIDIVELLIQNGADINLCNCEGDHALIISANLGHFDIAKLLIQNHADINHCDHANANALYFASQNGYLNIVELLIQEIQSDSICTDFNIFNNNTNCNPLMASSKNGHIHIVKLLIQNGADVNAYNSDGNTALIMTSVMGNFDIAKLLIDSGADINKTNNAGNSALIIAAIKGHINIVELILEIREIREIQADAEINDNIQG